MEDEHFLAQAENPAKKSKNIFKVQQYNRLNYWLVSMQNLDITDKSFSQSIWGLLDNKNLAGPNPNLLDQK